MYQAFAPVALGDVMVEAWGLLFDAVLFGFVLVWVNVRRAKKDQIERYVEELEDYRRLETEEASARSAGILVRLAKSGGGGRAPGVMYLAKADLRGAYLRGAHLRGVHLRGANLSQAKLIQADLREADLREADLSGADLSGVLNLEQWRLDSALGDRSTTLPDSLHHPEPWPQESTETPS